MAETIDILISEDEVEKRVRELAEKISADYEGREVCLVGILKGACFFMCDLAKRISVPWPLPQAMGSKGSSPT